MKKISVSNQCKRDIRSHYLQLITPEWAEVLHTLCQGLPLPERYRDHALSGDLQGLRDCHFKPDLVLLYRRGEKAIELVRLGSHSELGIG